VEEATVSAEHESVLTADETKKAATKKRARPKWEQNARDRVRQAVKKYQRPLADLAERDANEGDTRLLVTDFLCDGLGYDKYADLTTEYRVKGEFADFGVRVDGELVAFIEVKRIGMKLGPRQLRQVQSYAANEGVEWLILTNGAEWQVFHLSATVPLITERLFTVDLLSSSKPAEKVRDMFYLTREAVKKDLITDLWIAKRATSPQSLGEVLRSTAVVEAIRKELWRSTKHRLDGAEILELLEETVLRPECL
jgi:predicted type IV restriction endonuclease